MVVLFIVNTVLIFCHGEISQEKYGVISREKTNNLDYILMVLMILFFLNLYVYNMYVYRYLYFDY